ncbi:hypothetical protein GMA5_13 [Gordonia phage GMA5]|uniref:Minor tail protein n=1 Tax=Gordonia phage GMA5 TaxID=1647472 RepID=A0A0K0MWM8_9CAUD|nr:minor tail protein [Gordonia phage GMA5]AKI28627.1 hypothetical protein GMA5_13 [Gordonia phage GMA5]
MTVNPAPWIEIDGDRITCQPDPTRLVILDDIVIDWGRDHPLADRGVPAAQFRLWDPTGQLLAQAGTAVDMGSTSQTLGRSVVIGWTVGTTTRVIFRGTVSGFDVRRDNKRRGWLVEGTATDRTTDLGSGKLADNVATWPAETAIVRANRLKAAIADANIDITQVYFEPDAVSWEMGLTKVADKNVLQLLDEFYASFGLTWDYRPDENVTRPAPMRSRYDARFYRLLYRIPGTGDYTICSPPETQTGFGDDAATYVSTVVSGCAVSIEGAMNVDRRDRINRVVITYLKANGVEQETSGGWGSSSLTNPRITKVSTWLNLDAPNNGHTEKIYRNQWSQVASSYVPRMPRVIWDTDHFLGVEQAFTLTRCSQSWSTVSITSNPYAAALKVPSEFHIIGGTVRYFDGRWTVAMVPAWHPNLRTRVATTWVDLRTGNPVWASLSWNSPAARPAADIAWSDFMNIAVTNQPNPAQEVQ